MSWTLSGWEVKTAPPPSVTEVPKLLSAEGVLPCSSSLLLPPPPLSSSCTLRIKIPFKTFFAEIDFRVTGRRTVQRGDEEAQIRQMNEAFYLMKLCPRPHLIPTRCRISSIPWATVRPPVNPQWPWGLSSPPASVAPSSGKEAPKSKKCERSAAMFVPAFTPCEAVSQWIFVVYFSLQEPRSRWRVTCSPTPLSGQWPSPGPPRPLSSVSNRYVWWCWRYDGEGGGVDTTKITSHFCSDNDVIQMKLLEKKCLIFFPNI